MTFKDYEYEEKVVERIRNLQYYRRNTKFVWKALWNAAETPSKLALMIILLSEILL